MQQNLAKTDAVWRRASEVSMFIGSVSDGGYCMQLKKKESKQGRPRLKHLELCLFATVLEDTLNKMYILEKCNSEMCVTKMNEEMTEMLAKKFGVEENPIKDEFRNMNLKDINCIKNRLIKVQADRELVIEVLKNAYFDLVTKRSWKAFTDYVYLSKDIYKVLKELTDAEADNKIRYRELRRQRRQQRNHIKSVTYDTNAQIESLKSQITDASWTAEIRSRYVGNWQNARTEQHELIIFDKETKPADNIYLFKQKTDQEQRVHAEVEFLNSVTINETLCKVEEVMHKYDSDIEKIDIKIQRKRNDYEHKYETRLRLEETLEQHAILAKNWTAFKEERERARQYEEAMTKAAVTVQAWWRGLLVRLQLGPYKVVKRKAAAAKASDKPGKK